MKAERLRHRILTCAIALSALAIFCGCHVNRPGADHEKNQILYSAVASDPRTFNPILVTDSTSGELTGDLFDSLLRINPVTTLPEAGLAEKWDIAADNKAITFHLRHDVKWFDGQPFTAHDVLFTLDVIYDPKVPNSIRPAITIDHQRITAEAPDDYTVIMHLPKPFAPLLYSLGIQIIPAHILEPVWKAGNFNHTWGIDTPPEKIVGNGAYKMTRYAQSQAANYDRYDDYWMKDEKGAQLPRLHGQTVTIVHDRTPSTCAICRGRSMFTVRGPRKSSRSSRSRKTTNSTSRFKKIGIDTGSLFFGFNRNPRHYIQNGVTNPKLNWFTDLNFCARSRTRSTSRAMINLCFHGLAEPAVSDISPANKIFLQSQSQGLRLQSQEAADLLEAGRLSSRKTGVRNDPKGNRAGVQPHDQHRRERAQPDVRHLQAGPRAHRHQGELPAAGIHHAGRQTRLHLRLGLVLIGFTGGIEPNDGAELPALVGRAAPLVSEGAQAGHAVGSRDRQAARTGHDR